MFIALTYMTTNSIREHAFTACRLTARQLVPFTTASLETRMSHLPTGIASSGGDQAFRQSAVLSGQQGASGAVLRFGRPPTGSPPTRQASNVPLVLHAACMRCTGTADDLTHSESRAWQGNHSVVHTLKCSWSMLLQCMQHGRLSVLASIN